MSSKSNRRKITVEKSGQRPSVFERLGTKAEQSAGNSGYCRHWKNTGNCPFGSSCKNAMHHTLISPSKQRAASKDKEHSNLRPINKSQNTSSSHSSQSRLHSTVIPVKESSTPSRTAPTHTGEPGTAASHWEEDWNERSLEHADEKELERRRQQLQRELELQMKKEMRKRKISTSGGSSTTIATTTTKKAHRSSSSSSSTSTGSSSSSTGSSSEASSSSRGPRAGSKSQQNKQGRMSKRDSSKTTSKSVDLKKSRDASKETTKKRLTPSSSRMRSNSRSRQRSQANVAPVKRRRDSTSADSSGSDKRKLGRSNPGQHQPSSSRMRGRSPSPERKLPPERKRPALSHDKPSKRRDASPPPRKSSLPPSRAAAPRKRSATPPPRPPRRRSISPPAPRSRSGKRHGSTSRNASPVPVRRRSPSVERKDSRRGHTPPSPPADRSYPQRGGGRNSRRNTPETTHRNPPSRDGRQRVLPNRDSRQSPDRRPLPTRAASREPLDNKRADWGRGRDYAGTPPRGQHRSSPDSSNGSTTRAGVNRDLRGDKLRPKEHDRDRDRRRDAPLPVDKGRDKVRSRAEEGELPSLLSLMTQHPGHFTPQPQSSRPRALPRDEPQMDHRSSARDRNRFERYEGDRGGDTYAEHASDDHHRVGSGGNTKRGPPPRRELSPLPRQPRPAQKSREWGEFADNRGRDWERRSSTKSSGGNSSSMPLRQWGPVPGSEDQPRQNRMLPPLSVRNAMQAARKAGANSPNGAASQQSTAPGSPQSTTPDGASKGSSETAHKEKSSDEETNSQKDTEQEMECSKEVAHKRPREASPEKEESEPARKRQCMEELLTTSPITAPQVAVVTAASGLDLMESDLSDISDDADDILNAEGVEEPGQIESEEKSDLQGTAACEEEEEEEPVEDLLDTMDFEEISDGELEAEEARGGVDALTVDWAALMSQTRSREGDETKEAHTHRWQGSQLLSRLGVSMKLCGPELASQLGIVLADDSAAPGQKDGEAENVVKLLDPVAGVHVALRARRQQRESLFQLRDRRGLSAADDLAFRRQLNGLPAKKPGHQFNQTADPGLFHQAMQMLLAK